MTALNAFTGVNNALRPDLVGDPRIVGSPNQWFDNTVCDPRISGSCTSSTAFGVITNTRFPTGDSGSARQIQFAVKLLF